MSTLSCAQRTPLAFPAPRTALAAGVAALLLPLSVAAPAAAAPPPPATGALAAPAATKSRATMRISSPPRVPRGGAAAVGVRLLADGRYYPNRIVRMQKHTNAGWVHVTRLLTDRHGLARGRIRIDGATRLRAVYDGGANSTPGVSREVAVAVTKPGFRARAVRVAAAQAGKPYRWGATGPSSFDCSGLVGYAFRAVGKALPRTSRAIKAATRPISRAAAVPGDLVFLPGHVGIYIGGGKMIDAPRSGTRVGVRRIYSRNYTIRRVV